MYVRKKVQTRPRIHEFAKTLKPGQEFSPQKLVDWFAKYHPDKMPPKSRLVKHVRRMAVNNPKHRNEPYIRPDNGWDLFFMLNGDQNLFRLWDEENDPPPQYPYRSTLAKSCG